MTGSERRGGFPSRVQLKEWLQSCRMEKENRRVLRTLDNTSPPDSYGLLKITCI
jgi:hypothetical protein